MNTAIKNFMTPFPHTVGRDQPIAKAEEMMKEYGIHHLPVLEGGKLVGIMSDRDIALIKNYGDIDLHKTKIEESSTSDPYSVKPETSLREVAAQMFENKFSCALVVEEGKLVGIFSWVDALKAISQNM